METHSLKGWWEEFHAIDYIVYAHLQMGQSKKAEDYLDQVVNTQRRYVLNALEKNDWNVTETARQLDLARSHLYNLINDFELRRDDSRDGKDIARA